MFPPTSHCQPGRDRPAASSARRSAWGLHSIAVYSDADAGALHVALADEAHRIGAAPAAESYLSVDRLLEAARQSGAEAVHPGYGFLSENAALAEACAGAGLIFVGPTPSAIRRMGSKIESKRLAEAAGIPVVPGYNGVSQARSDLKAAAETVGYPLVIKADAGGGGRGMRVVQDPSGFDAALDSASREAKAAFGDGRVLLERYVSHPRHVEVQVFGDDARQPGAPVRARLLGAAAASEGARGIAGAGAERRAARGALQGRGRSRRGRSATPAREPSSSSSRTAAGAFYFLEMNTRLQVEHPVTEMVTGLDLVEWQLRVAAGEDLPLRPAADPLPRARDRGAALRREPAPQFPSPRSGR